MKYGIKDFSREPNTNVFVLRNGIKNEIQYTDGNEIERKIYNNIVASRDKSIWSQELIQRITDWPTEYHFSPIRHNLLRHFRFKETDHILELGCGCGAITRQLGESGAKVTSVEGTLNRAKSAAARCRDLENVKIYCSNFQDLGFSEKYEYVTLIGVLEYAPLFFASADPFVECLLVAKKALKPDGILIVAIENRLGLKYFNGLAEDHVDKPYFGIEDRYDNRTAKTFGRLELKSLLESVGFVSTRFQYPFPDYKLPEVVIDESAFSNNDFNCLELIRHLTTRDYSKNRKSNFSEFMAWKSVSQNQLLQDFSNSFLVLASNEMPASPNKLLAVKYTTNRKLEYNTKTEFVQEADSIKVVKKNLCGVIRNDKDKMVQLLKEDDYYIGVSLQSLLREKIVRDDFQGFINGIKRWIDYLVREGLKSQDGIDKFDSPLLNDFVDCLPSNIIVTGSSLNLIDREWEYNNRFTIKTLFIRYWLNEKKSSGRLFQDFIKRHLSLPYVSSLNVLINFAKLFEISLDEDSIQDNFQIFSGIGDVVYGVKIDYKKAFPDDGNRPFQQRVLAIKKKVKGVIRNMLN